MPKLTEPKIRVKGIVSRTNTRTLDNQVGVDSPAQSIRVLPTFTDINTKHIDKTGNDTTGDGTTGLPYLTIQKALDTLAGSFVYAMIQDSGDYTERVDLKGGALYAKDGGTPTIKYLDAGFELLDDFGQDSNSIIEWEISGVNYILCSTDSGIYRSSDGGKTFTSWVLVGKVLRGMDFFGGDLYVCNETDLFITKVTSAGVTSTFKDFSTEFQAVTDIKNINGVLVVCGKNSISGSGYSNLWYYKNSTTTWTSLTDIEAISAPSLYKIAYNSNLSTTVGYCAGNSKISASYTTGLYKLISDGDEITDITQVIFLSSSFFYQYVSISNNSIYYISRNYAYKNSSFNVDPSSFTEITSDTTNTLWDSDGRLIYEDTERNSLFLITSTKSLKSLDGGSNWSEISTHTFGATHILEHKKNILIAGGFSEGVFFNDLANIKNSVVGAYVDGLNIDGLNICWTLFNGQDSDLDFKNCNLINSVYAVYDIWNNISVENCIIKNNINGLWLENNSIIEKENLYYDNSNHARFFKNATIDSDHITATKNGYGLTVNGVNIITAITNQIIYLNDIRDIYAITELSGSNFDYVLYVSSTGTVTPFSQGFIDNPLFVDEANSDFNLKDIVSGYLWDSIYLSGESGEASDNEDLGCFLISRVLGSPTYGIDYTVAFNPKTKTPEYKPSNYKSFENQQGVTSEFFTGTKLAFRLGWDANTLSNGWVNQAYELLNIYKQENEVFEYGLTEDGGATWKSYREGTGDGAVVASDNTIEIANTAYTAERWATNFFAGFWVLIDSVYYRIISHVAKAKSGSVIFILSDPDGTLVDNATEDWSIDFMKVKILSSRPFSMNVPMFESRKEKNALDDSMNTLSAQPITNYSLSMKEAE